MKESVAPNSRYIFLDALRGIAAILVFIFHLADCTDMTKAFKMFVPKIITSNTHYGFLGVQIFFVLSGFVIAHSLRSSHFNKNQIALFVLRRQLRLDPVYWFCIGLTLVVNYLLLFNPSHKGEFDYSINQVFYNAIYLQDIMQVRKIVDVSWTLCIEIQFYLFFIALMSLCFFVSRKLKLKDPLYLSAFAVFVTSIIGLILKHTWNNAVLFPNYWPYFAGGVLCYWAWKNLQLQKFFYLYLFACTISMVLSPRVHPSIPMNQFAMGVALATVLVIYISACFDKLSIWGGSNFLLYMGKVSYSFYLIHFVVLELTMKLGIKLTKYNSIGAIFWSVMATLFSIGIAHLIYTYIEKPSMNFSNCVKDYFSKGTK